MKHHFSYFYNALLEYYPLHQTGCETQSPSSTEKTNRQSQGMSKCPPLARTQARKHVGQSATAPRLATHAADAVAAHPWHERDSDVIFTSHVK